MVRHFWERRSFGRRSKIAKALQLERKDLVMVEAVVKVKAEQRAKVSVSARAVRKVPARSKAVRTARFQLFQCITKG